MNSHHALAAVEQFVSDVNLGRMESARAFFSPEFFNHIPEKGEPTATEVFSGILADIKGALPDLRLQATDLMEVDGLLKGRITLSGTHDGPIWGAPPSGAQVELELEVALRTVRDQYAITLENFTMPKLFPTLRQMDLLPERMDLPAKHATSMPEILIKVLFTGQAADKPCSHLDQIKVTEPETDVCPQCMESGDIWPALRMCLICGFVGCCDTSKNKHMKAHYEETGHPIFRSIHLNEGWVWCYEDNAFFSKKVLGL